MIYKIFKLVDEKTCGIANLSTFSLLVFISVIILVFRTNNFWSFVFAIAFVHFLHFLNLFGRIKFLEGSSDWIRHLEQKYVFYTLSLPFTKKFIHSASD